MTGFAILLTFALVGSHGVKEVWTKCPDMACVESIRNDEDASPNLIRLRVFKEGEQARVIISGLFINTPLIDDLRS